MSNSRKGYEFENEIARILKNLGYKVTQTPFSGDYGVDIIAEKYGEKIAIQVKSQNRPVGVRAVQEVFAGKEYYWCDEGWVVSRSEFTERAKEMAQKLGIELVHYMELQKRANILRQTEHFPTITQREDPMTEDEAVSILILLAGTIFSSIWYILYFYVKLFGNISVKVGSATSMFIFILSAGSIFVIFASPLAFFTELRERAKGRYYSLSGLSISSYFLVTTIRELLNYDLIVTSSYGLLGVLTSAATLLWLSIVAYEEWLRHNQRGFLSSAHTMRNITLTCYIIVLAISMYFYPFWR